MISANLLAIRQIASQLMIFVSFVARGFKTFYIVVSLTVIVLLLEYLATSLMIPMASGSTDSDSLIIRFWIFVAEQFGLSSGLRTWIWFFLIILIGRLALGFLLSVLTTQLGKNVHESLSGKIFGHVILSEPLEQVYDRSVGHYITLAGDDTFRAGTIVSSLLQALVAFCTAVVGMLVLYQFSIFAFIGCILFLLFAGSLMAIMVRQVLRTNSHAVNLSRDIGTIFVEALNGLRSIRTLHAERFVITTYSGQIHSYIKMLIKIEALRQGAKAFPALILVLLAIFILRPDSSLNMSDTAIFAGTIIVMRIFTSLGQLVAASSQVMTEIRAFKDINALVGISQDTHSLDDNYASDSVREIELRNVSFGYTTRNTILKEVSFSFKSGFTYAITGPSGSGKSTLADIILGLSMPSHGDIRINRSNLPQNVFRRKFALVEQQPKIFSTTIKENLLLGHYSDDKDILLALRLVNLEEMILNLPQGLETRLSYLGENFSGGQRQRLGIARALLRKPDVLILDEATSALDPITRTEVVANIRNFIKDGIIIFITHDLAIASLADQTLEIGNNCFDDLALP